MKSTPKMNKIKRWIREIDSELEYVGEVEITYSNGFVGSADSYHFSLNREMFEIIVSDQGKYFGRNSDTKKLFASGFTQESFLKDAERILENGYEERIDMEIKKYFDC